jgi:hypothetical protein
MRRVELVNHNPYNNMNDLSQAPGTFRYHQGHTDHQPHCAQESESSHDSYAHTPGSTHADLAFSPWLMEVPTYTASLSRTSSLSGSEYTSTPPTYAEPPMYHTVDQTLPPAANYMAREPQYVNNQELNWQPHLSGSGASSSLPHLPQHPVSSWQPCDYASPSLAPRFNFEHFLDAPLLPYMGNAPSSVPQSRQADQCTPPKDKATVRPSDVNSPTSSSNSDFDSDDSESDDSDSNAGQRKGSCSNSASQYKSGQVMKLGKWSMIMDPYSAMHPPARHFVCPLTDKDDNNGRPCQKRFARPEHLRRHINTVHGGNRNHLCKIPTCNKAFSRSDNLRDHYWTHLERGGRIGKNDKMSLGELKEILGPKEKKLIKKLKKRLAENQMKQKEQQTRQKPQYRSKL